MRRLLAAITALCVLFSAHAEEKKKGPRRKSVPIAGGWMITSEKQEKTKTEGTRTLLFTATGSPVLTRSSKLIRGNVDITAKAEKIECDFRVKELILTGSPEYRQVNPKTKAVIKEVAGEPTTVIRVPLHLGEEGKEITVTGGEKPAAGKTEPGTPCGGNLHFAEPPNGR